MFVLHEFRHLKILLHFVLGQRLIFILLYKSGSLYFFSLNIAFLVLNSFVYKNSLVLPDSFEICVVNRKNVTLLHCFYVCYNYNILKRF